MTITVITPPTASTAIERDLVALTEYIGRVTGNTYIGGVLGGEFGYGVEFENNTFLMFPFYWGDCDCGWDVTQSGIAEEPHDTDCYQTELDARFERDGLGYDDWRPRSPDLAYDERQKRERAVYKELTAKYGLSMFGCAVHCTCTRRARFQTRFDAEKLGPDGHGPSCPTIRPNFRHKPSGLEVRWYKWIGRDTEYNWKPSSKRWRRIFEECVASVTA